MVNEIIEGDCLDVMPTLAPKSFDLVLTDPPYAMPATYYQGWNAPRKWSDSSVLSGWWKVVVETCKSLMKDDAMFATFANGNAVAAFWPALYNNSQMMQLGVWDKMSPGLGVPMSRQTEHIVFAWQGKPYRRDGHISDVFRCGRVPPSKKDHPAQKPDAIIRDLIQCFCPPGGLVLDPFAGSGVVHRMASRRGTQQHLHRAGPVYAQ